MENLSTKEIFAARLKELRDQKGQTQEQFAKSLSELYGVSTSRGSISFYEKAERTADVEFVAAVAKYCNVSTDYLVGITESRTIDTNIKSICEATGLKEEIVKGLLSMNRCKKLRIELDALLTQARINESPRKGEVLYDLDIFNIILEEFKYADILSGIRDVIYYTQLAGDWMATNDELSDFITKHPDVVEHIRDAGLHLVTGSTIAAGAKRSAEETFNILVTNIVHRFSNDDFEKNLYANYDHRHAYMTDEDLEIESFLKERITEETLRINDPEQFKRLYSESAEKE